MISQIQGNAFSDDRGSLRFVNDFNLQDYGIKRFYQVENNDACSIRAWHGHMLESKYVYCARGSAIIAAKKIHNDNGELSLIESSALRVTVSALTPKVVCIAPGYANGFKTLESGTILIFFSSETLKDSSNDDYRFKFNSDDTIFDTVIR